MEFLFQSMDLKMMILTSKKYKITRLTVMTMIPVKVKMIPLRMKVT